MFNKIKKAWRIAGYSTELKITFGFSNGVVENFMKEVILNKFGVSVDKLTNEEIDAFGREFVYDVRQTLLSSGRRSVRDLNQMAQVGYLMMSIRE